LLRLALLLLLALPAPQALYAQSTNYVGDNVFIVLHRGPGTEYRWVAKLNPGTELQAGRRSDDGDWTEVTTTRGTSGWVRSEFLTTEAPAQVKLPAAVARSEQLSARNAELSTELKSVQQERLDLLNQLNSTEGNLGSISDELNQLKQISGKAVQLDQDNRRLVEESENLRSEVEMLEAENQRLQDKLRSEDFINGALAVLLGVVITLVVPRLWPKRRKNSSWGSSW
jgi:SH3 domain protein